MENLSDVLKKMKPDEIQHIAIMNIDEGEEFAGAWASPVVPGTGTFKLLAKKRIDHKIEWAHFIHRENKTVGTVFRGELDQQSELLELKDMINNTIVKITGLDIQMQEAGYNLYTLDGHLIDPTLH